VTDQIPLFRSSPSGALHNLLQPDPSLIQIGDIAHHLSHICRFNGGTQHHYSVAEHSIRVAWYLCGRCGSVGRASLADNEKALLLTALLHDAAEAYLGDCVAPLKKLLPRYREIESWWQAAIAERFDVDLEYWAPGGAIDRIDKAIRANEGLRLVAGYQIQKTMPIANYNWEDEERKLGQYVVCQSNASSPFVSSSSVQVVFLELFHAWSPVAPARRCVISPLA
jgi:hypothetical protein